MTTECVRTFAYAIEDNNTDAYIDLAQSLSNVNRKLYRQGRCYYIQKLQWISGNDITSGNVSKVTLSTLPFNWIARNSWVKSFGLWTSMNKKVLADNPSVQGRWHDFKMFFDGNHFTGGTASTGPTLNLKPLTVDSGGVQFINDGEWYMSKFILPQHDVDPTSGEVLAADDFYVHMLGDNLGSAGAWTSVGSIQGYADTRAQMTAGPTVPADMSESWMTQLTDDGSQEPELADIIEAANDAPPYDADEYTGGGGNFNKGILQTQMIATVSNQIEKDIGFPVPLGLLKVQRGLVNNTNGGMLLITLAPGKYNGVLATEMKQ